MAPHGNRRAPLVATVRFGTAELRPDPARRLAATRIQVATARSAFGDVCPVGDAAVLRGRRAGNLVLVAAHAAGGVPVRRLGPAVLHGAESDGFSGGARPRLDAPS